MASFPLKHSLYRPAMHHHLSSLIAAEGGDQVTIPVIALFDADQLSDDEFREIAAKATEKMSSPQNHQNMRVVYVPELRWFLAVNNKFVDRQNSHSWFD